MTTKVETIVNNEQDFIEKMKAIVEMFHVTCTKAEIEDVIDAATEQVCGKFCKAEFSGPSWRIKKVNRVFEILRSNGVI